MLPLSQLHRHGRAVLVAPPAVTPEELAQMCSQSITTARLCEQCGNALTSRHQHRFCSARCGHAARTGDPLERFWAQVDRSGSCWLWRGLASGDYGRISLDGRMWSAHRFVYHLTYGPIPDGLWVLHHCDVRSCCRPEHLYLGTHAENTRDAVERGRMATGDRSSTRLYPERHCRGSDSPHAKLTEDAVREIRRLAAGGASHPSIARRYGVAPTTIWEVVARRTWAHVD